MEKEEMIPKIIHYCWFGGKPLPDEVKRYIASWRKHCPDYEIKEWNERNFDCNANQYVKEAYEAKKWAFVTDYVRLYALYHEGGIYMDTDVELLKNLDPYLGHAAFSGFENDTFIPTAIMGSVKHGVWMEYLLSYYDNRHFINPDGSFDQTTNVLTITSMTQEKYQIRLDNTYQEIEGVAALYPKEYFCPKSYETGEIMRTDNTVCIHHFRASWHDKRDILQRKKRSRYIEKYGADRGAIKYQKWARRNFIRLAMMQLGIKGFTYEAIKRSLCIMGRMIYGDYVIAMESLNGFDGNSGALYNYLCSKREYDQYRFLWLTREDRKREQIDHRTWRASFQDGSLKTRLLRGAARYSFFDNLSIESKDRRQVCVYLTHGCPTLKNVKGLINIPPYVNHVLCTSTGVMDMMAYQLSTDKEKMFICGLPRNDALFQRNEQAKKVLGLEADEKVVLWLPTFRQSAYDKTRNDSSKTLALGVPLVEDEQTWVELNEYLAKRKIKLIIKMHPGQDMEVVKAQPLSNLLILSDNKLKRLGLDLYQVMPVTDALLSDYSSVAFDYMLLDKPIGYVIDDIEEYKLGFAFERPEEVMPGHKIECMKDLYGFIEDVMKGKDPYKAERNTVSKFANEYQDGNNCKRVAEYIGL